MYVNGGNSLYNIKRYCLKCHDITRYVEKIKPLCPYFYNLPEIMNSSVMR